MAVKSMSTLKPILRLCLLFFATALAPSQDAHAEEPALRILVTNDGVTYHGNIEQTEFGYKIEQQGRQQMILPTQTRCVASSLEEAYATMYQEMEQFAIANKVEIDAQSHHALARWCYQYGLYDACQYQLTLALARDPHHAASVTLARKFAPKGVSPAGESSSPMIDSLRTSKSHQEIRQKLFIEATEVNFTPLGSLPRDLAANFQKMQPILASHCGKGGCHDATTNRDFVFQHLPRDGGMYRGRLENNLSELVEAFKRSGSVDRFNRLVVGQNDIHPQPIFSGPLGPQRLASLHAWTRAYGESTGLPVSTPEMTRLDHKPAQKIQTIAFEVQGQPVDINIESTLEKARQDHQPDPFDPSEFNRLTK